MIDEILALAHGGRREEIGRMDRDVRTSDSRSE